jgi:enediyne biosynthesis protein E7
MIRRARTNPPGPRGIERPLFIWHLRGPKIVKAIVNLWKTYGDFATVSLPNGRRLYFVNDPIDAMEILQKQAKKFVKGKTLETFKRLIGDGVATSERPDWIQQRRMVMPNFHVRTVEDYSATILATVQEHRRRWLEAENEYQDFNVLFPQLSQDIVARTLLGADLTAHLAQIHAAWDSAMNFVLRRTYAVAPLPLAWPLPSHRRFHRSARLIRNVVDMLIASQMDGKNSLDSKSFLARLLASDTARELHREEIRNKVLNVLFAGLETTANGLSSALYLILSHPNVKRKLLDELHSVLGKDPPSYGSLKQQWYLRQVVHEVLRLYPPVSIFPREALEDVQLSAGVLPKGATVLVSPFVLHRQPGLWQDPELFKPERFTSLSLMEPPHFFAFGAGSRSCVGDQFAINEMMLTLSDIFQNCALKMDTSRPISLLFNGTLRPDPVRIRITAIQ